MWIWSLGGELLSDVASFSNKGEQAPTDLHSNPQADITNWQLPSSGSSCRMFDEDAATSSFINPTTLAMNVNQHRARLLAKIGESCPKLAVLNFQTRSFDYADGSMKLRPTPTSRFSWQDLVPVLEKFPNLIELHLPGSLMEQHELDFINKYHRKSANLADSSMPGYVSPQYTYEAAVPDAHTLGRTDYSEADSNFDVQASFSSSDPSTRRNRRPQTTFYSSFNLASTSSAEEDARSHVLHLNSNVDTTRESILDHEAGSRSTSPVELTSIYSADRACHSDARLILNMVERREIIASTSLIQTSLLNGGQLERVSWVREEASDEPVEYQVCWNDGDLASQSGGSSKTTLGVKRSQEPRCRLDEARNEYRSYVDDIFSYDYYPESSSAMSPFRRSGYASTLWKEGCSAARLGMTSIISSTVSAVFGVFKGPSYTSNPGKPIHQDADLQVQSSYRSQLDPHFVLRCSSPVLQRTPHLSEEANVLVSKEATRRRLAFAVNLSIHCAFWGSAAFLGNTLIKEARSTFT